MSEQQKPADTPEDLTKAEDEIELQEEELSRISGGLSDVNTIHWK